MTSLELFRPVAPSLRVPPDWGTGREAGQEDNIWVPKAPTWQYGSCGETEERYELTPLQLSNIRLNDQRLPDPQSCDMRDFMITGAPFPAEHPYASHISRKALFPNFDTPYDPKTGVGARREFPKNVHIPANPHEVIILKKAKGNGYRHELQTIKPDSEKEPLRWPDGFDQYPKDSKTPRQRYYPSPTTLLAPNVEDRADDKCYRGNMVVSQTTADATKNVERNQWLSTYQLNHTGLGTANPMQLDNLNEKLARGGDDDSLWPRSQPPFHPARPLEGRHAPRVTEVERGSAHQRNPEYQRPMTLTEREEHRLLNGNDYVNLPETADTSPETADNRHSSEQRFHQDTSPTDTCPRPSTQAPGDRDDRLPSADKEDDPLLEQRRRDLQQMEVTARWKLLQSQTPEHDIGALGRKMAQVSVKSQPRVFYGHEGDYQRERAGLYQTSYDPGLLRGALGGEERRGPRVMDTSDSHKGALDFPTRLNDVMAESGRHGRTLGGPPGSVPQPHSQPSLTEAFRPFGSIKSRQTARLTPGVADCDVRTQEGGIVLRETTYGRSYNTRKFQQERELDPLARQEPLVLISRENQTLEGVRPATTPRPGGFNNSIGYPVYRDVIAGGRPHTAPEVITHGRYRNEALSNDTLQQATASNQCPRTSGLKTPTLARSADWSNPAKTNQSQPVTRNPMGFSYNGDGGIQEWIPGSGQLRPQSSLLKIQDSFSKSDARRRFHERFPENAPDLRENIVAGRGHWFGGINAQLLRGAGAAEVDLA